jgi:glutamyl-tRNA reductase
MRPLTIEQSYHADQFLTGIAAYNYLLEVICGLQSRLVGENEIVGQFKENYKKYVASNERNAELLTVLEKLLQDAKHIRSNYLIGLHQKTYASIARKHIVNKHNAEEILILGSGQLAEDLVNQFKKKARVFISARNKEKVAELQRLHSIEVIEWEDSHKWHDFAFIANSIGFEGTLLDHGFFETWSGKHDTKLFVDLGSPTAIETNFCYDRGVMKLEDVFSEGAIKEREKREQIEEAKKAMEVVANKRYKHLQEKKRQKESRSLKLNYAW